VEGIAAIYFLENGGVAELLSSRTRQSLQSRIDETLAVLGRTEEPGSSEAAAVGTAIKALRTVIATEVVSTLGVTATFSDNDGDS
jgi:predicted lipoprotein